MGRWVWDLSSLPDSPWSARALLFLLSAQPLHKGRFSRSESCWLCHLGLAQGQDSFPWLLLLPWWGQSPPAAPCKLPPLDLFLPQRTAWGHIRADLSVWAIFYSFKNNKCISVATKTLIPFYKWCTQMFHSYRPFRWQCLGWYWSAVIWCSSVLALDGLCHNSTFLSFLRSH